MPINTNSQQADFSSLISSLQSASIQLGEPSCTNSTSSLITIPIVNNNVQATEIADKGVMLNFMKSMQAAGMPCVENPQEKTISISIPNISFEQNSQKVNNMFKVVNGGGSVQVVASSNSEDVMQVSGVSVGQKSDQVR